MPKHQNRNVEEFRIVQPSSVLAPYIKHYWMLEIDEKSAFGMQERVIPYGCMEMVFHSENRLISSSPKNREILQPRLFICGQNTNFTNISLTGKLNMIAITFLPYGAKVFFDIPLNELSGQAISLTDMDSKVYRELEEMLLDASGNNERIKLIESFLIRKLHEFKEYNFKRVYTAIQTINQTKGNISISQLADYCCLSYKQFKRIFAEHIGANPKDFLRIVRFQKALYLLEHHPELTPSQLAFECGYYDQSHLINEFKIFSGYTPKEYVAICPPHSDYFS